MLVKWWWLKNDCGVVLRTILAACGLMGGVLQPAGAQSPVPAPIQTATTATAGGVLHGAIKSGNVPLPGVTVTATNTLTGKKFATATDITGAWSMTIPQNGRYVVKTEFAAFAAVTHEALLNAAGRDQTVNFELVLASRAVQQEAGEQQTQALSALGVTPGQAGPDRAGDAAIRVRAEPEPDEFAGSRD